jgi:hypothetical protein
MFMSRLCSENVNAMIYGKRLNIFCLLSIQYYANFLYTSWRIPRPYSVLHILVSWHVGKSFTISARRSVGFMPPRGSSCMSFLICSKICQLVSRQKLLLEGSISLSGFSSRSRKRWTLALGTAPKSWLYLFHSVVMCFKRYLVVNAMRDEDILAIFRVLTI